MVLFAELMDGLPIAGNVAQTKMEKNFLKHGFPLVDKAQFQAIQSRDATLSYADPMKAAALGRRFGAGSGYCRTGVGGFSRLKPAVRRIGVLLPVANKR